MYRFQHPEYLWLLIVIPILIIIYIAYLRIRRKRLIKLGDTNIVNHQIKGIIPGRRTTKFTLIILSITTSIFALANLQKSTQSDTANLKGVDVIFALDVSKSMLAKDIQPDRLTRAKQLIEMMIDKMKNDRVGLVVFAGRAYLQTPLTTDYSSAKMLLSTVSTKDIPTQGTVLSDAINLSTSSFSQQEKKYKTLILISDGEDHDDEAIDAAKDANKQGVIINTVGIGSPQGTTIIEPTTGKIKVDKNGQPIITKLNETELQDIAKAGGGSYQLFGNANNVATNLTDTVNNMEKRNMGSLAYLHYDSYFQYFLIVALVLLIINWLLPLSSTLKMNIQHD